MTRRRDANCHASFSAEDAYPPARTWPQPTAVTSNPIGHPIPGIPLDTSAARKPVLHRTNRPPSCSLEQNMTECSVCPVRWTVQCAGDIRHSPSRRTLLEASGAFGDAAWDPKTIAFHTDCVSFSPTGRNHALNNAVSETHWLLPKGSDISTVVPRNLYASCNPRFSAG